MVSFALILMTLPSRVAEVRAGRADRARHGESSTERADLSSGEPCSGVRRGERLYNSEPIAATTEEP
jgi:hypothetical protein